MKEFLFGVSAQRPNAAAARILRRIAARHGAAMINNGKSGTQYRRHYVASAEGDPGDTKRMTAIFDEIRAAGLLDSDGFLREEHLSSAR